MPTLLRESSQIVLAAIETHIAEYGVSQKTIAIDAGLKANYVSMLKSGDRVSLARRCYELREGKEVWRA